MKKNENEENILENLFEGIYFVDKLRTITSWNNGAVQITGFDVNEVVHRSCFDNILNHVDENGMALCFDGCPLHATLKDGKTRMANVFLQHKDGHRVPVMVKVLPIHNNSGEIEGAVEIFSEIQHERHFQKDFERLQREASEDSLTGVPNRKYLSAIIESKIREYKAVGISFGINFIDIDDFKHINDTYGHDVGDEILKLLVRTISSSLRKDDVIGRLGGEEFVILFSNVDSDGLSVVSEKIRFLVETSKLRLPTQDIAITISIGSTLVTESDSGAVMLQRADHLMYRSKKTGKNRVTIG